MSSPTKITFITVVRNGVHSIGETIESVGAINYSNKSYIVIDGGSTDGTLDIIKNDTDTVDFWLSEHDRGIYDAMNKGWAAAPENSLILFLGAGDRILSLPDNIETFGADAVLYGDVWVGSRLFRSNAGKGLVYNNTLHHQALFVPKSLHIAPPFDLSFRMYADFDFNQRLCKAGVRFIYTPSLVAYALPGGYSEVKDRMEILKIVRKNYGSVRSLLALGYLINRYLFRTLGNKQDLQSPEKLK